MAKVSGFRVSGLFGGNKLKSSELKKLRVKSAEFRVKKVSIK